MKTKSVKVKTIVIINIAFLFLVALVHVLRLLFQWPITFGTWPVPLGLNLVALLIVVALVYYNIKYIKFILG